MLNAFLTFLLTWITGFLAKRRQAETVAKVKDAQIKVAVNRPSKPVLVDKLRRGKF